MSKNEKLVEIEGVVGTIKGDKQSQIGNLNIEYKNPSGFIDVLSVLPFAISIEDVAKFHWGQQVKVTISTNELE